MARYRSFLFPEAVVEDGFLTLDSRESHHLVRVFRAKVGATIEVLDGKGRRYLGRIEEANGKAVRVAIDEIVESAESFPRMTLLISIPKGKTMDLILRMATEIGVTTIQPIFTDQGEMQMKGERLQAKVDKWQLIMIESCKQCGLSYLPELAQPIHLKDWLSPNREDQLRIVASLEEGSRPLLDTLSSINETKEEIVVAVGPEGDFTPAEYEALHTTGFLPVRLGANVLRSETAAAYILSVVDQQTRR